MGKGPFKMKSAPGGPMRKNFPSAFRDEKRDADELVSYTSPNKPADYGGSDTSHYETRISRGTKRLIDAGAPKEEIEKSKARDIANFKKNKSNN